jgi:hypothetical protein
MSPSQRLDRVMAMRSLWRAHSRVSQTRPRRLPRTLCLTSRAFVHKAGYGPVGPLSGKTGGAVLVWLIAWAALGRVWKDRKVDFGKVWSVALTLVILGLLGTFPLFFDLFG